MSAADRSNFVYVTFIRTAPEKLWKASSIRSSRASTGSA